MQDPVVNPARDTLSNQNLQQLVEEVEKDLLDHIIENMRARKITVEESQSLASDFLSLLPPQDKLDLLNKLRTLSGKYPLALEVYYDLAMKSYNEEREKSLDLMSQHIKSGDIEKALEVAKTSYQPMPNKGGTK